MCGIVGYVGKEQAAPFLLDGLSKLEYRGYDSSGIATFDGTNLIVEKCVGRLAALEEKIAGHVPQGHIGIAHTDVRRITTLILTRTGKAGLPSFTTALLKITCP